MKNLISLLSFSHFDDNREGRSNLDNLRLNSDGVIENWPKDFFGDQFGEIIARETAVIKRRREEA